MTRKCTDCDQEAVMVAIASDGSPSYNLCMVHMLIDKNPYASYHPIKQDWVEVPKEQKIIP